MNTESGIFTRGKMPIFNNRAYFNVTSFVLDDVNVKGGNVVKPWLGPTLLIRR